jgi:hypothetical protein
LEAVRDVRKQSDRSLRAQRADPFMRADLRV